MNEILKTVKRYKHALLPIIYGPIYLLIFGYLEKRPVSNLHIIEMKIDQYIPFCEYFVIPYYLWFAYVAVTVFVFIFLERSDYYKLCIMLGIGMTLFLFVSYVYPNGLNLRPDELTRNNFCMDMIRALYKVDTSTNVFPSIHCFNSMACNAAICHNKRIGKSPWIRVGSILLSTSIILSTLFIKQHSLFDFLTALILFAAMYIPLYLIPELKNKQEFKKSLNTI